MGEGATAQNREARESWSRGSGLGIHYVDWGSADGKLLAVLVHGGRDHCRSWDDVVASLPAAWGIVTPDLRGHGDSDWASGGGYTLWEYVGDLDALVRELRGERRVVLVGHSLGGAIVLQYAGMRPDWIDTVIAVEPFGFGRGFGPDEFRAAYSHDVAKVSGAETRIPAPDRVGLYLDGLAAMDGKEMPAYGTLEAVRERMRAANPGVTDEVLDRLARFAVRALDGGGYRWKFDNRVRLPSPHAFDLTDAKEIWSRITAPVLIVNGAGTRNGPPTSEGMMEFLPGAKVATVPNASHYVHQEQPRALADLIAAFAGGG
jgi:pimeloyl-ACP methyl ester carboxylesterase